MKKLLILLAFIPTFVHAQQVVGFISGAGVGKPVAVSSINPLPVSGGGSGGAVTIADGANVVEGTTTDAACSTDNGTCTIDAVVKRIAQRLTTINSTLGTPMQATGGTVGLVAQTTGGVTTTSLKVANNTTSVAVCASACTLYAIYAQNNSATIAYLKTYNAAQGSTTCGSGTPVDRIMIPANSNGAGVVIPIAAGFGAAYGTALTTCVTTGYADNDTTAPAASVYLISAYTK